MKGQIKKTLAILLIVCFAMSITATAVSATAGNTKSGIVPVKDNKIIYEELSIKWWKWANSIPIDSNPILDETGKNGAIGQSGDVWFLAGTFNKIGITRKIEIPTGKVIFFPIINIVATKDNTENFNTIEKLFQVSRGIIDDVNMKDVTIDSTTLTGKDLDNYRVGSRPFIFTDFPENNYAGITPVAPTLAVSDGYWIMLKPLSEGKHTISFHGSIDSDVLGGYKTVTGVTYHITVKPKKS